MTFSKTTLAITTLAATASALMAAPMRRDCATIPSKADSNVVSQVYTIARSRGVSDRVLLATFETAWIESHANNLTCGDQDSVGVFQQRPSQGWGSIAQCTNVTYSTNSFLNGAIWNDGKFPRYTAGQLAQSVQVSEFPDRYDQAEAIAKQLIAQAQRQLGVPISTPALSATSTAVVPIVSSSGSTTITITATVAPTATTSGTVTVTSAPTNIPENEAVLAPGTLDMTCGALYDVAPGDTCTMLQKQYGSTLAQLRFWNSDINSKCTNLKAGYTYCVSSQVAVPPSNAASGINKNGCTAYSSTVKTGNTCKSIGKKYGVSQTRIITLNKSLNSKCSNLKVGKSYCITSIGS